MNLMDEGDQSAEGRTTGLAAEDIFKRLEIYIQFKAVL
jgi:hypothetical protein